MTNKGEQNSERRMSIYRPSDISERGKLSTFIIIFCVLFSGLLVSSAFGQEANGLSEIKPLQIGDTIPKELWSMPMQVVNHPNGSTIVTLSDYRDKKLIILDFWTSWCSSCIKSFPTLKSIQSTFEDDLQILLVNPSLSKDDKERVLYVMNKNGNKDGKGFSIPSVLHDEVLMKCFQPKVFPRLVWIDNNGVIIDITGKDELNQINLNKILTQKGGSQNGL